MKRAFILLVAVLMLAACSQTAAAPTPTPLATPAPMEQTSLAPVPSPTFAATSTPTAAPTATATAKPKPLLSLTSGYALKDEYHPINVQIENMPDARPQAGMSQADVVYECLMEGRSMTRFQCVFNDNIPNNVGPVRSARLYFVSIAEEYKGILTFFGGPEGITANVDPKINKALKAGNLQLAVNGLIGRYGTSSKYKIFKRVKADVQGNKRSAPHNVYADLTKVLPFYTKPVKSVSHFRFNSIADYSTFEDMTSIEIKYTDKSVDTLYKYDPVAKSYNRFVSGKSFIDANTNKQITVKNIIVQYARTYELGTSLGHLDIALIGTGKADVYVGGKYIQATWKRPTEADITKYYDAKGNEVQLLPGNTWVQEIPNTWKPKTTGASVVYYRK